MSKKIYLDYAATTPVDPNVFEAMEPYFSVKFGNASSLHQFGQDAQQGVILARNQVANFLGCEEKEVIFTGGATEGNNAIIKGFGLNKKLAQAVGGPLRQGKDEASKIHIISTKIEHESVSDSIEFLVKEGLAEASFLTVSREGIVDPAELAEAIKPNTVLVSVMYANNEIGSVQPIAAIGELLKKLNKDRANKIYFHTDAVQAVNYLDCNVQKLGVDFLTLSAHKFYGPKGIGAMFVKQGSVFTKYLHGGEQEFKMRSGTHNTPGIVGLGAAIELIGERQKDNEKIKQLRDKLIGGVLKIEGAVLNGSRENRLPNNANFRFAKAEGEAILIALDLEGIAVSTGSACASRALEPSHVLLALGLEHLEAHSSIRFSLGRFTEEKDIDRVLEVLPGVIGRLRGITGGVNDRKSKLLKSIGC
ncbi:MAG: cysteine desulfurase family protein [Candidatus Portnoybacteria bacterium]|nr:cysteine desulfurase family protein [Candidatus Portnoybacteria bacterium]MDD4982524.1 cysteine desulfurase family protein [Candidatus Portnoybacteria bacterium]